MPRESCNRRIRIFVYSCHKLNLPHNTFFNFFSQPTTISIALSTACHPCQARTLHPCCHSLLVDVTARMLFSWARERKCTFLRALILWSTDNHGHFAKAAKQTHLFLTAATLAEQSTCCAMYKLYLQMVFYAWVNCQRNWMNHLLQSNSDTPCNLPCQLLISTPLADNDTSILCLMCFYRWSQVLRTVSWKDPKTML